ncbi:MAG TPA: GatB/YqeY domain-containing protein [Paludibacteraceae bacterium]|jgi:uncharacterized protein YqeY|nr:GatB/YqeY domain-containing protein [Paludibacteraceae bacterium]
METLFDKISEDIKQAMFARDKVTLEALRGIKKEFLEAKVAKGSDGTLSDEAAVKILQKMIKQRKESAQIYAEQNRPELAEAELAEVAVIEKYLPPQMNEEQLKTEIKKIIDEVGAKSMQEMGKIIGIAVKKLAGKADSQMIANTVKSLLGK